METSRKEHRVRGVPAKKKAPAKKSAAKVAKKPALKKVAKKAPAKKAPAKKAPAKKVAKKVAKKAPAKKAPAKPFPSKVGKTTLTVDEKSQTVSVATVAAPVAAPVIEERRLVMPPPARPTKSGKRIAPLNP